MKSHRVFVHGAKRESKFHTNKTPKRRVDSTGKIKPENAVISSGYNYETATYKCRTCRRVLRERTDLVEHMNEFHPDISLDTIPELKIPVKTNPMYTCRRIIETKGACKKRFLKAEKVAAHFRRVHMDAVEGLVIDYEVDGQIVEAAVEKGFVKWIMRELPWCEFCEIPFLGAQEFKRHIDKCHPGYLTELFDVHDE